MFSQTTSFILENMNDPYVAKKEIWLAQMKDSFKCDESTLIIGHSSGAEAAMRYAELNKVCKQSFFIDFDYFNLFLV